MNLERAAIVLRQRSTLEGLDLAVRFVLSLDLSLYVKVGAVLLSPCLVLCALARYWGQWSWWWVWLLAWCLATLMQGAFTVVAGRLMFSEDISGRTLWRELSRKLPSYIGALLVTRVVLALGSSLVLLAPQSWARGAFVYEAVLLEGAGAREASRRAARFVRYHVGHTLGMLVALVGLQIGCVVVFEYLGQGLVEFVLQLGKPFGDLFDDGGSLFALAGLFVSVPFSATARFLSYIDARTRRDGWDIQVRFAAIDTKEDARFA